jgi:DNA-binding PadR family transcriptional regulator
MSDTAPSNPRTLLTPAALHILMSLAQGIRHGYGIKRDVEQATGGSLHLGPGTLYEAIHRMEAQGWIAQVERESARREPDYDGRRKYYALTDAGRAEMEAELARLDAVLEHARDRALMPRDGREAPAQD